MQQISREKSKRNEIVCAPIEVCIAQIESVHCEFHFGYFISQNCNR